MQKKIGYDARMIENSGIGIRIQHILKFWSLNSKEAKLYIFGDPSRLKKYDLPKHAEIIPYLTKIYSPKEFFGHPKMAEMDVLDIPHFNVPLRYLRKCIVTIHDLIPYHFKETHASIAKRIYLQIVLRSIKWFAKSIIAVSKYTKDDLIKSFGYRSETITVVYNGIDLHNFAKHPTAKVNSFLKTYHLPKQYLFTVGIGKTHKNFPFLLSNLEVLWKQGTLKLPLVIGGISKEIPNELLDFQKENPNRIFFLEHLPYDLLPLAYQGATLFVYPSLFEGFGFPVLEAQTVGTVVLSSDASVLPEVLRDSAIFFDPKNNQSFQTKLTSLLSNQKLQKETQKKGLLNANRFLWKNVLKPYYQLYQPILKES
ncbi:glycosyltransferase, group 1 family protein [Leptospira yanagawae serovar Saopaulo str. Sao Paulo = ATCC 700523]|uniref:Glycosyltransferase, group 1 family protein n=1 Tax=Leptospira yanagawae serovar Saopaulo str. Sao Paulo = ATCC 700523 TaxID=1249483 RepID=A0A5E8HDQ1_9LEPT|nr:glycosyltransferase family 1 protein [Leptospira yanagawae]EOQ89581.1 glycosyltransferase, group 1 family protein [Leptospira yanagawae serovar Saopaulo str. Sao Paulo = ATCC 700523]